MAVIPDRLRAGRLLAGYDLNTAAILSGVANSSLSRWETGRRILTDIEKTNRFADLYKVNLLWLMGVIDQPQFSNVNDITIITSLNGMKPLYQDAIILLINNLTSL